MSQHHYDDQNIFARILRGEIPCKKVDECPHTLSFEDIQPQAAVHILVIPKGAYVDMADFAARVCRGTSSLCRGPGTRS